MPGAAYQYAITALYEVDQETFESTYSNIIEVNLESEACDPTGDINNDNIINILDIVLLVNIVLDVQDANTCGDLNEDGIYNILDIVLMVNIVLGN